MRYRLTKAQYLESSSVDEKVLCYHFIRDGEESKYLVWIQIKEAFREWQELYHLDDDAMIKFLLKLIEPDLIRTGFKYKLKTFDIQSISKPKIDCTFQNYNLSEYILDVPATSGWNPDKPIH